MNRLSVFVLIFGLAAAIGFVGCGGDDGPTGPTLSVPNSLTVETIDAESISLEWVDEDMSGFGYHVERNSGADWVQIAELNLNVHDYIDTGLDEGTTHQYRIKTYGRDAESAPSPTASATTLPLAPSELSAERLTDTSIGLTWTNVSGVATGVEIQRSMSRADTSFATIEVAGEDAVDFTDTGLEIRTTYYYRIRAQHNDQESQWSDVVSAFTNVFTPFPPANMTITIMNDTQIRLNWSNRQDPPMDGIVIEYSLTGNDGWNADSIGVIRSYIFSDLRSSTMYYFRAFAYNDIGNSAYSDIISGQTDAGPPMAPNNFDGIAEDFSHATLTWSDNSDDETGFVTQRKESFLNFWDDPVEIAADAEEWEDDTVLPGKIYHYRLAAYNDVGTSDYTASIEVIIPVGPPSAPINLVIRPVGIQEIRLDWQPGSLPTDGYLIQRKTEGDDVFRLVNTVEAPFFTDVDLDPETWYAYRLIAYREVDGDFLESGYSEVDSSQTLSLTAFEDDFEGYELNRPPDNVAFFIEETGSSSINVTNDSNHEGTQGLKFLDSVAGDNWAWIWTYTRPLQKGSIGMWMKVAPDGAFGFMGGNADDPSLVTFQIQLNTDGNFLYRDGLVRGNQGGEFPVGQWAYYEIVFDFETHIYNLFINGEQVTPDPKVQNDNLRENAVFIFLGFSDATIDYVYIDDFLIMEQIPEEERLMRVPMNQELPAGLQKVSDFNTINIHR